MIGVVATGLAIAGAAILATLESPPAPRIWTPRDDGTCQVCGSLSGRHSVVGARCPHVERLLTDEQVMQLWRRIVDRKIPARGISLTDCLDASPEMRRSAEHVRIAWAEPNAAEAARAREKICDVLNTMEPT